MRSVPEKSVAVK